MDQRIIELDESSSDNDQEEVVLEDEELEKEMAQQIPVEYEDYPIENVFRDNLQQKWKNLIFRKINNTKAFENDIIDIVYYYIVPDHITKFLYNIFVENKIKIVDPDKLDNYFENYSQVSQRILRDIMDIGKKYEMTQTKDYLNLRDHVIFRHCDDLNKAYEEVEEEIEELSNMGYNINVDKTQNIIVYYTNYSGSTTTFPMTK